ncbi:MAG TPA: 2-C-methyl-D-erythritol 2,4-cyclodiphosphate synthase [Actinomycetota bacterium]
MRVGTGYDAHAFDNSGQPRPLVLGGVTIAGAPGLAGRSDADVVSHAVIDALLGAAALGDLGDHFPAQAVPDGVSSLELLRRTQSLLAAAGFRIANVDVTAVIQDVRVGPHRQEMRSRIAGALGLDPGAVSVKATTTDRLGFAGRGEGAEAIAVALVEPADAGA